MRLESIQASALEIPFKGSFKHASAERVTTQAVYVRVTGGGYTGHGEGCPREYVTGESVASARAFIVEHSDEWIRCVQDVPSLHAWIGSHEREIDANPAAWAAVELAMLDLFGRCAQKSVETLLDLPPLEGKFRYTAVLGDSPIEQFKVQLARYRQAGFRSFKIKLAGEYGRDQAKVRALEATGIEPTDVRADANNLWQDADMAIRELEALRFPFCALEEPLRSGDVRGMERIGSVLGTPIILDESLARAQQIEAFRDGKRWIANVRVSKMGGVVRSLAVVRLASEQGLRIVVGAHVGETSLLTRAGLTIAGQAGKALFAQEGAFGTHLLERDIAEPQLVFGAGGVLDIGALRLGTGGGWGLTITP